MPRLCLIFTVLLGSLTAARAADEAAAPAASRAPVNSVATGATDLLERFVNWLHESYFPTTNDHLVHWVACGILFFLAILLRKIITNVIFFYLKKLAAKTETTLDDKLFPALETPTATLVMALGISASLTVLQVSEQVDRLIGKGSIIAILGVILWGFIRAGGAILDHLEEIAHEKQMTVATFMPLIKKSLFVLTVVVGLIIIADSLGAKIGALLTSLGIGGLAFALAAQDTIANLFGSLVVVMDQPFKVGDTVKVGANTGTVEDIGLRSTKIRLLDKSLVVIPNKSVASEAITNLARFTGRRVEQVLGLTYNTRPDQMESLVAELRKIVEGESEIDASSVHVYFRDFNASSMDVWLVYVVKSPDFAAHMKLRQRLNLAFMRAVETRGLSFAFPTQTVMLDGPVAKQIAERK
ncbi:MAG: mechanosensitive ion channel family protein [Verrucomicrobia bacterium]|nr:mechanosensitive ion channel family protein [Verrucomicrobiota bacterium]